MNDTAVIQGRLQGMELARLGPERPAGLCIVSLPLPRQVSAKLGVAGAPGCAFPLGQWHDSATVSPRRVLLAADNAGLSPATLEITCDPELGADALPDATMRLFETAPDALFFWERHSMTIEWGGHSVELALGLRYQGQLRWWEACNLVEREQTPFCRVVEMGGAIPVRMCDLAYLQSRKGYYDNEFLHIHNWLNGQVTVKLYANGVCDVVARHTNSRFFDDGGDLDDTVPVIGIRVDGQAPAPGGGAWDGTVTELTHGPVAFDFAEMARLATPEQPGEQCVEQDFLVIQPYQGMELFGGAAARELREDSYILRGDEQRVLRGMSRSLRFGFSLNQDRAPTIARYLPPAWWYGVCEELVPAPVLPVRTELQAVCDSAREWSRKTIRRRGFEDGAMPRGASPEKPPPHEPGWEGEAPYAQFLSAWVTQDADEYDDALRAAVYFTDVCIDHAAKQVRMHGWPPDAFSLPMARIHACLAAYLETGEPFLRQAAESVIQTAYSTHKNSWPRMAVGRDACFIRGAVMLYRFLGNPHYRDIARDSLADVVASQNPDGSFGDQGGGAGIHAWAAYITKPWMGCMAVGGAIDWLELFPGDNAIADMVKRFADWLMRERFDHDGVMGWSYQHNYRGDRDFFNTAGEIIQLPGAALWHRDYLARVLTFCALRFDDASYYNAWHESFVGVGSTVRDDHAHAQSLQFVPWVEARLWNAVLSETGVRAEPVWFGARTPRRATLHTPDGMISCTWNEQGSSCTAEDGNVQISALGSARK
ncbi:MAG: hypothetical protein KAI66_17140 [Lentisphaeria bacterium]|nr:hypothetical protein [Lentisphaeria bacterium]